jgi:hypothetical protein
LCSHAIEAFSLFYNKLNDKKYVIKFVTSQLKNTRPAVKKKAVKFHKEILNKN